MGLGDEGAGGWRCWGMEVLGDGGAGGSRC